MGTGPPGDAPAGVWLGLATESKGNNIGNISASLCLPEYPGPLPERLYTPGIPYPLLRKLSLYSMVLNIFDMKALSVRYQYLTSLSPRVASKVLIN